jgi:hypothetical protein
MADISAHVVGPTGLGHPHLRTSPSIPVPGWREVTSTPWGMKPAAVSITSAASPARSAHDFFGVDAHVWLGRCAFRTVPRLAQNPTVAGPAP